MTAQLPVHVALTAARLDVQAALDFVADPSHGAVDLFLGVVRNSHAGRTVQAMTYDAHAPLAESTFRSIAEAVQIEHGPARVWIEHRSGRLDLGEASVVIAVGTPHRDAAFAACRRILERLKTEAPIWKQEHYVDGDSAWLPGTSIKQG